MRATSWRALGALSILACIGLGAPSGAADAPDWRAKVRDFAKTHFKQPAWGFSHNVRDYDLAKALAGADHVTLDDEVLYAAAYLHDIAAFAPWEDEKKDHSDVGAEAAAGVLKDAGFPMHKLPAVQAAIKTHMYYRDPKAPEAVYLHDADALDWLGAIGVARIFGLVDPKGGEPDGPKAAAMLEENLAKVPGRVVSPAGKARVNALAVELKTFLENLKRETDSYKTL
jgi:uncharacterized protein